jgi:hypothetical protein
MKSIAWSFAMTVVAAKRGTDCAQASAYSRPPGEPHWHVHRHEPVEHEHPHAPDLRPSPSIAHVLEALVHHRNADNRVDHVCAGADVRQHAGRGS